MLTVVDKELLVLTRMRCCQRRAAFGVVSFVGGNNLGVSSGYWDVVVLVEGSLLLKQLLFRKMGAKLRVHNTRCVAFHLILARNFRQIRVRSRD